MSGYSAKEEKKKSVGWGEKAVWNFKKKKKKKLKSDVFAVNGSQGVFQGSTKS